MSADNNTAHDTNYQDEINDCPNRICDESCSECQAWNKKVDRQACALAAGVFLLLLIVPALIIQGIAKLLGY